jgi:uridine kinase
LLPNGEPDYETIDALDMSRLGQCLTELVRDGKTRLPIFDFQLHRPLDKTVFLELEEDAAVIVEGIHAFHPRLQEYLPPEITTRLFINTLSRFVKDDEVWLARRDIRLCRRILRDDQFRASPFANTMKMWPQVVRGEELYMFPYADTADCVIDTTFAFEPCMLKDHLLERLHKVDTRKPNYATAEYLLERLSAFESLPLAALPADSMLREFTG